MFENLLLARATLSAVVTINRPQVLNVLKPLTADEPGDVERTSLVDCINWKSTSHTKHSTAVHRPRQRSGR